jgi:predicted transcriptional regulator
MADADKSPDLLSLTAEVVSAIVTKTSLSNNDLSRLIVETHGALAGLVAKSDPLMSAEPEHIPAVSVRKSLAKRDVILSMIDGRGYKSLRRHLTARGLTPAEYRARYKLPKDYPMVAPAYSDVRRELAKRFGLGNAGKGRRGKPKTN